MASRERPSGRSCTQLASRERPTGPLIPSTSHPCDYFSPPASKRRILATTCTPKSGQQVVLLFIRNCVICIPTLHPSNRRLIHSISCPSDYFHLHPNVASQRPPAPKERPTGPPLIHLTSYPTMVCNRPPCRILLTTGTLFYRTSFPPNNHLQTASDVRYLHPSYIIHQQLSILAPHSLYRWSSAPTSIPDYVSVTVCRATEYPPPHAPQYGRPPPQSTNYIPHLPQTLAVKLAPPSHITPTYYPHPCTLHITAPRSLAMVQQCQQHHPSHNLVSLTISSTSPRPSRVVPHRLPTRTLWSNNPTPHRI